MEIFPLYFILFSKYVTGYSEQCGECVCIRSIETIFCEGKHISNVESIPIFYTNYKTLVLRDTNVLLLPNNICSWKVERIIIKQNIYFDCASLEFCENKLYDTDCKFSSALSYASTKFVTESTLIISSEIISSEKTENSIMVTSFSSQTFSTPSFTSVSKNWKVFLSLGIVVGLLLLVTISLGCYVFVLKKRGQSEMLENPPLELDEISGGVVNHSANIRE